MIVVENYTCAECGGLVDVSAVTPEDTSIPRPCGHATAPVHANLRGTMYGMGAVEDGSATMPDSEIAEDDRAGWDAFRVRNSVLPSTHNGTTLWRVKDVYAYLDEKLGR